MNSIDKQINDLLEERQGLEKRIQAINQEINELIAQPIQEQNIQEQNIPPVQRIIQPNNKDKFMTCDRDQYGVPLIWSSKPWEYYDPLTKKYSYPDGTIRDVPF